MGAFAGPRIISDGLIFSYDMANTKKSWKGKPTTNVISNTTYKGHGNIVYNDMIPFPNDPGRTTYTSIVNNPTAPGGNFGVQFNNGTGISLTSGETYFFSFPLLIDSHVKQETGSNLTVYLRVNYDDDTSSTYNFSGSIDQSSREWQYLSTEVALTDGKTPTGTCAFYCYADRAESGQMTIGKPQLELGTFATPFVNGTRSNTESLIDPIGSNTITASSLTYAVDSFNFSTTGDNLSLPNDIGYTTDVSTFAWFKSLGIPDGGYHIVCGGPELEISIPTAGTLRLGVTTTSRYVSNHGSGMMDGEWHYVGLTFSGTTKTAYIDGLSAGTQTTAGALTSSFANRKVGKFGSSNTYGTPTEIPSYNVYNRALTADEVFHNFSASRGRFGI